VSARASATVGRTREEVERRWRSSEYHREYIPGSGALRRANTEEPHRKIHDGAATPRSCRRFGRGLVRARQVLPRRSPGANRSDRIGTADRSDR
jgi:hypothetical protein